jgi:hypothetical protein
MFIVRLVPSTVTGKTNYLGAKLKHVLRTAPIVLTELTIPMRFQLIP